MVLTKEDLDKKLKLTKEEEAWFSSPSSLPLTISDYYFSLIEDDANDPIRREVVPSILECNDDASIDPLAEVDHSVTPRLIHRYTHRAALLTTDHCFTYCRHCFRRRFTGLNSGAISTQDIDKASNYLKDHKEIKELLLTGGDLFTLPISRLDYLFNSLKSSRPDMILRLCTRAVVTFPEIFTQQLMDVIKKYSYGAPFLLLTHYNHPRELTKESIEAVNKFLSLGIPAFNQTVLLKGVNDICFGEFKNVVREKIGLNYKEPENHLDEPEVKKMLQGFKLMMVDISKHALSNFDEMEEIYSLISDGDQNDDIYDGFTIYYNKEEKFEAIEIFPNENIELFVRAIFYILISHY